MVKNKNKKFFTCVLHAFTVYDSFMYEHFICLIHSDLRQKENKIVCTTPKIKRNNECNYIVCIHLAISA
jgi:hypothetical protein